MLALLEKRYAREVRGNGPAWAFVPKVRNAAGFGATRTMDALAMSLWPSRGLELHGHEIKVSRSDWLRELADPSKAEAFTELVDRWWLVCSDAKIVAAGELPPTWGLMVASGRGLRVMVQAPELPATDSPWMPKTFRELAWARELVAAAREHDVAPFVKQLGTKPVYRFGELSLGLGVLELSHAKGGDIEEWPPDLRVREFPVERAA